MQLLSQSSASFAVELHIISSPSLDATVAGKIEIALQLHVTKADRSEATEACLGQCLSIAGILETLWDRAELRPILGSDEFERFFAPFVPEGCHFLHRRSRPMSPADPFGVEEQVSVGFLSNGSRREKHAVTTPNAVLHVFPWVSAHDDWPVLLDALLHYPMPQWVVVRLASCTDAEAAIINLEITIRECERFLASALADQLTLTAQIHAIRDVCLTRICQLRESALHGAVLLFSPGPAEESIAGILGQSISGNLTRGATDNPYRGGFDFSAVNVRQAKHVFSFYEDKPFTTDEAACAFRLPLVLDNENHGLPVRRSRTIAAELPAPSQGSRFIILGINSHRGNERPIQVGEEHLLKHRFLIGMTGAGKTTKIRSEQGRRSHAGSSG
jgi:hypothetical protein